MIDIHAHILPGLDDGSDSPETSLMMAYAAVESGVTAIIATPHCNQRGLYENYASPELTGRLERLRGEIKAAGIPLEVYQGMEVVDAIACADTVTTEDGTDTFRPAEDIVISHITVTTYKAE